MPYQPLSDRNSPPAVYVRAAPEPLAAGPVEGPFRASVVVVGGGFTGISAALHLAEAGAEVAVLEAKDVGWGASGRAFGQVVPYLKIGEDALARRYGPDAERVIEAVAAGPDLVFGLIEKHRIACWPVRTGLILRRTRRAGGGGWRRGRSIGSGAAGRWRCWRARARGDDRLGAVLRGADRPARRAHQSVCVCARAGEGGGGGGRSAACAIAGYGRWRGMGGAGG